MIRYPFVAILTATFNQEDYIKECIESVLAQSYPYWHLLILDDGSTDGTSQIAHEYAKADNRITVMHFDHGGMLGLASRYNAALEDNHDEFVAVLDGDDFWPLNKLQIQLDIHYATNVAVTFGNVFEVTKTTHHEVFSDVTKKFLKATDPQSLLIPYLESRFTIPAVSVVIRRSALDKIGGFQQPLYLPLCDFPTWLHVADQGIIYIDDFLGYWRHSQSQTTWTNAREVAYGIYKYSEEFVNQKHITVDLKSKSRTRFLADASYRSAVLLWKNGNRLEAYMYLRELFLYRKLQNVDKLCTFFLVVLWNKGIKTKKKLLAKLRGQPS